MDFFSRQDVARRKTKILVLYFLLAVVCIIAAVNAVAFVAFLYFQDNLGTLPEYNQFYSHQYWHHPYWIYVSIATLLVIVAGNFKTWLELRGGGQAVAEYVGAVPVDMSSNKPEIRRFINVVEEMAIASGVVMPSLYVEEQEHGINAFVAGFKSDDIVLVVTRGALDKLDRDALQGVIGHEFSHIFHGDMSINVRLIGLIAGISFIGQIGDLLMDRHHFRYRTGRDKNRGAVILIGLALFLIGYLGLFFGRLIKAAISRQREFLADASSVQYTRNQEGIASALTTILFDSTGSHLVNERAEDIAHMCFGEALSFSKLFATHPPLEERINQLYPGYLRMHKVKRGQQARDKVRENTTMKAGSPASESPTMAAVSAFNQGSYNVGVGRSQMVESVGAPSADHLGYAHKLLDAIPDVLHLAAYSAETSRALIYAMITASMKNGKEESLALIKAAEDEQFAKKVAAYAIELNKVSDTVRLPLIELCVQSLRGLERETMDRFIKNCNRLAAVDKKISLFEFVLLTIIQYELTDYGKTKEKSRLHSFNKIQYSVERLLSLVIYVGRNGDSEALFEKSISKLTGKKTALVELASCKVSNLKGDLEKIRRLVPVKKRQLLQVLVECIMDDGKVNTTEAEMIRAISMVLDAPMPPVIEQRHYSVTQ